MKRPSKLWLVIGHDGRNHLLFELETGEESFVWDDALEGVPSSGWRRIG